MRANHAGCCGCMQALSQMSQFDGPLLKGQTAAARLLTADAANPARELARRVRDARQLGEWQCEHLGRE